MKILISGGSGFIGKNLVNYLIQNNYNVMLIGRNVDHISFTNLKKQTFDLNNLNNDYEEIIKYDPDVFIHLAWEGIPNYNEKFSKKNYLNTIRIIKDLLNYTNCSKIISTGSCWEYNDGNIEGKCKEDLTVYPQKPFSIYKNKIFNEVFKIANEKNILFNWLRLFYVYGPGQKKESIIPMLIEKIKNKKKIDINFPANINDYIYIDDVVKILCNFIENKITSGIYNLGTGKGVEVKKLLKIIDTKINHNNIITSEFLSKIDENKRNQNFYACTIKLSKFINNFKFTDINSGINNLIESS
jgi:nucleoside-diphosphate-sugar epimerase